MNDDELLGLARDFGTPLYAFDDRVLQARLGRLRSFLPDNVELCYAVKANTFIIPLLTGKVARLEACSTGEARICMACGVRPNSLVVSGVNKDAAFMDELIGSDAPVCRYTVESRLQFDMLLACARRHGARIPILLRLTSANQFGLDADELVDIVAGHADDPHLDIWGIQYFSGTQKTSTKRLARELRQVSKMMARLEQECGFTCRELEFGPGFPVQYFQEEAFDEDAYLAEFVSQLRELDFRGPVVLELGRSIAASCGTFLTSVVDAKVNAGQRYAIVDGGMNHLVYFGQSLAMREPKCSLLGRPGRAGREEQAWNVCGSLCSVNDILAKQIPFPGLEPGDVLAFADTGAYCMTEGISLFLSRDLPRVCLVDTDGQARLVRDGQATHPLNCPKA